MIMQTHPRGTKLLTCLMVALGLGACAEHAGETEVGLREYAIVGGDVAEEVPWAVQIYDVRGDTGDFYQCTGTLVARRWVLTAQHCLADEGETTAIRIGSNAYRQGRLIAVDHVEVANWELDLALLHLTENAGSQFVPLAEEEPGTESTPGTIYGWGSEGTPRVMAPFLKRADVSIEALLTRADLGAHLFVSSGVTGSGWSGDSGGPLMVDGRQVAVESESEGGQDGTDVRAINRHVNLIPHLAWLRSATANDDVRPPADERVVLHDLSSFQGVSQAFGVGRYRLSDLPRIGNDRTSAVRVPPSLKVTVYQHDDFAGQSRTYTADTNLIEAGFNDSISSIVVEPR